MGKIIKIENADLAEALKTTTRQYFVGNLSRPQKIMFIRDDRLEIGISSYPAFQSEPAHKHMTATEYQYMISGWTEYMDVDSGEIYEFRSGDFYAIEPDTAYSQRVKAGTNILFIKVPSVNDKQLVEIDGEQLRWLQEKMRTVRTDFYYRKDAPAANSIRPAAAVAILNSKRELLMLHRRDNKKWTMPGGTLEFGESMTECALREVKEESGLNVEIIDIIGTYTDPNIRIAYSDGEVRQEFTIMYYGEALNYDVSLDDESSQFQWVPLDDLAKLPLADSQKRRIEDVLDYLENGNRKII
ncbi:MAG: NUDIX domain-containing protein [Eubacteriales bacterium]|nr:NUDIX domain-containing protein [Eubacteriales bacterium]